jgi:hypothetical protein
MAFVHAGGTQPGLVETFAVINNDSMTIARCINSVAARRTE